MEILDGGSHAWHTIVVSQAILGRLCVRKFRNQCFPRSKFPIRRTKLSAVAAQQHGTRNTEPQSGTGNIKIWRDLRMQQAANLKSRRE
jgi:hypothetical protein